MPFPTDRNDVVQLAEGLPGCKFDELLTNGDSPVWLALLRELENAPNREACRVHNIEKTDIVSPETKGSLQKVAPGPWRSFGGYFDYTDWQDRERFMELDMAIARCQTSFEVGDELEEFLPTAA